MLLVTALVPILDSVTAPFTIVLLETAVSASFGSVIALSAIFKVVTHLSANKLEVIEPDIKVLEASNKEKEFAPTFNLIL